MSHILPAGRYYIGDPCYVLGTNDHAKWMSILDATNYFDGEVYELDGHKVWAHGTAYGDGCYSDNNNNSYPVDAGLIGVIPMELVEGIERVEKQGLGAIHTFDAPFECSYDDGTFLIGDIIIETGAEDEDEEEDDEA